MNRYVSLRSAAGWRRAFLRALALTAAGLLTPRLSFADVPPQSYTQNHPSPMGAAALQKLLADAQTALKGGNARLAVIYLRNAVSAAPGNGAARVALGKALFQAGDAPGAERELRQAGRNGAPAAAFLPALFQVMLARGENQLLLDQFAEPIAGAAGSEAAEILKARALALQKLKRGAEAIHAMDRSLELRRDVSGLLTRARLSLQQGDFAAAARIVDDAAQAWPGDPDALLFKVEMLLMVRDNAAALDLASQVSARFPNNLPGRFARVEAFLRLNQDAKAKAELETILAKNPGLIMASYYKALLMARAGDTKGAWGLAQTLPANFRDSDQGVAAMVAQMAISAGDIETGTSMLARMLKLDPSQLGVRVRLAGIRIQQDSPGAALNLLRPVLDSPDPRVIRLLATVNLRMNRPREALAALKKLDLGPGANATVKRGIALLELRLGNPDEAIKVLTAAVAKEPSNPIVVAPLIDVLIQKRRFAEALAVAGRWSADPKQRAEALVYRGSILMLQRDTGGARTAFDAALAINPRSKTALYSRATLLESLRHYDEASRDLNAILSLDNKDMSALLKSAEIAIRRGDHQNARRLLDRAIALSPQAPKPRIALVRYLNSRHDLKTALAAADDCVRAQAGNADCVLLLGQIQSTLGKRKEALASFRRYATLQPQHPAAHVMLGAALSLAGDRTGAARAFEAAADLAPEAATVKLAQINFQFAQGKTGEAVALARAYQVSYPGTQADLLLADTLRKAKQPGESAVLEKSLSDRPSSAVLLRLVEIAKRANDNSRADGLMRGWLTAHPADQGVRLDYAGLLLQQGANARAIDQYQTVLKQNPDNVLALNNLGWLVQRDDPKRALALLTRAWKLAPNSAMVADTLGWLKLQQKDAAGALPLLQRAHALQPGNGQITYHLAAALDANAKKDAARALLNALLASGANFRDRSAALQLSSQLSAALALRPSR